jgi:hypothetical protein
MQPNKINIKTKLGIIGMGVLFSTTAAAQSISVEPQHIELHETNATFNIRVQLSGDNIAGVQFDLNYNSDILEVINVSEGNFLKQDNSSIFTIPKIDNDIGLVRFASARFEKKGVYGTGNIAEITFKTKTPGMTTLQLNKVTIKDPGINTVNVTVNDGFVAVKNATEDAISNITQNPLENPNNPQNPNDYLLVASIILIALVIITYSKFVKSKSE